MLPFIGMCVSHPRNHIQCPIVIGSLFQRHLIYSCSQKKEREKAAKLTNEMPKTSRQLIMYAEYLLDNTADED